MLENRLIRIAIIFACTWILQIVGKFVISRVVRQSVKRARGETSLDERKRENTIITIVRTTYVAVLWIIAICLFLTVLGVNVAAVLTGAGLIGVIAGLSVQNTVKDFLAGFFILTEKQYRVGDIISVAGGTTGVNGASGKVEEITLRITKLRDVNGTLTTVRNGEPTIITNKTYTYASTVMDIVFTYESDIKKTEEVINKLGQELALEEEWKGLITEPIRFLRVEDFSEKGVVVRIIGTVQPAAQWEVGGEFRKRLLEVIKKEPKVHLAHTK